LGGNGPRFENRSGNVMITPGEEGRNVGENTTLDAVMVCGAGHSGSTLLGLILGGMDRAFYVGEGGKIRYLHDPRKPLHKRVCKICGETCPVWSGFHRRTDKPLYRQVADHTGASILIDTTKDPAWIEERTRELKAAGDGAHLVLLLRDGRAVVNSRLRKYPDRAPEDEIERWLRQVRAGIALFEAFDGLKQRIHYEELSRNPQAVIENLCAAFSLPFDPEMLAYQGKEHHPLGGNNATQFVASNGQADDGRKSFVSLSGRGRPFYENLDGRIEPDNRWEREFSPSHAHLFEKIAGKFNAQLRCGG
jgi:hypothetical protein